MPTDSTSSPPESGPPEGHPGEWRLGAHSASKDGPMRSIWAIGTGPPDEHGRRPDDRLVGSLLREDAERAVMAVRVLNELERYPRRYLTGPPVEGSAP